MAGVMSVCATLVLKKDKNVTIDMTWKASKLTEEISKLTPHGDGDGVCRRGSALQYHSKAWSQNWMLSLPTAALVCFLPI